MIGAPTRRGSLHAQSDGSEFCELQRVGKQILEYLLHSFGVGDYRIRGQIVCDLDGKIEALSFGDVTEGAQTQVSQLGESYAAHLDVHLSRLDLTQVENVVDQGKQIGPGRM